MRFRVRAHLPSFAHFFQIAEACVTGSHITLHPRGKIEILGRLQCIETGSGMTEAKIPELCF